MEYFDILNCDGRKTGLSAPKGSYLKKDQFYLAVHMYLYNPFSGFLIQKRSANKDFRPNSWDLHMGHVISGETSINAACREINEELGLVINQNKLNHVNRYIWSQKNHIIDIFFCIIENNEIDEFTFSYDEVKDLKFISLEKMIDFMKKMSYRPQSYRKIVINEIKKFKH